MDNDDIFVPSAGDESSKARNPIVSCVCFDDFGVASSVDLCCDNYSQIHQDELIARKLQEALNSDVDIQQSSSSSTQPLLHSDHGDSCSDKIEQSNMNKGSMSCTKLIDEDRLTAEAIRVADEAEMAEMEERRIAREIQDLTDRDDRKERKKRKAENDVLANKDSILAMTLQREELTFILGNKKQRNVLDTLTERSRKASATAMRPLLQRFKAIGFDERDLEAVLAYIRLDAPIIIHIKMERVIDFFLKDTHYRNLFETGTSGGTPQTAVRTQWEDRMFDRGYHDATPSERVKYGVLNVSSDPSGIATCRHYGDSYFLLNNDRVRLRTTFADTDTGSAHSILGMVEHYAHVLLKYPDKELQLLVSIARHCKATASDSNTFTEDWTAIARAAGVDEEDIVYSGGKPPPIETQPWIPSAQFNSDGRYREAQIHGDIRFDLDIEALVVASRHGADEIMVKKITKFCEANNINFWFMDS